ncbi:MULTISPECIES: aldehyde dehydrogenase family protein [Acinetobacter]|uniref:Sorbosone dehydrogenase n=4 Tax=Acinetobacter baumannii TaxID=470 RepID=A0AAP1AFQ4_ACIBA|nr:MULTISPECIES: aldehyde dehydrogenase family protein [Acinetobacter]AIL80830.1 sorbosone dehydrogenase [Acinetobacter baumannii]AIS06580.1 sorbosone dehydrogenase [Acinetobacter baumannii]APJ19494.1 sorbosone dehydrogenase [Acinetobacter baumannii]ATD21305.1 sorbosone dehydrogenase [Acinetobacter baumannii]AVE55300.1 sorbosone dehydrogenase [Acinetobacter baumannii]
MREYQNWINGQSSAPSTSEYIVRTSPADGTALAKFPRSGQEDVDIAVAKAQELHLSGQWSNLAASERAKLLNKFADLIEKNSESLAKIEAEEVGKPIFYARGEILWAAELVKFAASLAWQIPGEAHTHLGENKLGLVTREARGVVGLIVPWNFPLVCLFQKLPYALAAGCPVVIKPSEFTSGTALEVAKLAKEAGLPDGLINIVCGRGSIIGDALTRHPDVKMISFTGSTGVGKTIARLAADDMTRVALELGGKAANVVFADADFDAALDGVLFGVMLNQGEECVAGTRLIIEESIADSFVEKLVERAKKLTIGHPLDENTQIGPLIHQQHFNKVLEYIEIGKKEGAKLVLDGSKPEGENLNDGYYVGPTIFTNVKRTDRIFQEEIFGPVLTVTTFNSIEEAVDLANDVEYGLGNGLWTKDIDKAINVSKQLQSGTVYVNTYLEGAAQLPFGGYKQSGYGRENGVDALLEYMEVKSTFIKLGARTPVLPNTL